ncbi:MAG: amino acid permease [Sedimentisphaerales bacterium]|nr:amino acid permease [Sedimentisphaerales bacterium]
MQENRLNRTMGLKEVFCIASGAMISSGLFVLPGLAYSKAGPGVILSYFLASLLVLPGVLSKAELATAMPKSGGTYFFVERSLGPVWGLFSGLAGWFSLALKSGFAIVGMALFVEVMVQWLGGSALAPWQIRVLAAACGIFFTALNTVSVRHATGVQVLLVLILIIMLAGFILFGFPAMEVRRMEGFLSKGWMAILATAGLVFVSYGGVTQVATIAEEVRHPGKNLPLGMFLAWFFVTILYVGAVTVSVGVMEGQELAKSYAPLSVAAGQFMGSVGFLLLGFGAIAAYVSTANGGILAASRAPMAMSRDNLLPSVLARVHPKFKTPMISVLVTGSFMTAALLVLDLESLVKTASTLMILLFLLDNASVIIMRESRIQAYQPKFLCPLYPYMQIGAILFYVLLIVDMGAAPLGISAGFVAVSVIWYFVYVRTRVQQVPAAMHIVERVTDRQLQTVTLENELRDILLERDAIVADRFDRLVQSCRIIDVSGRRLSKEVFGQVAEVLSQRFNMSESELFERLMRREAEGSTVIAPGLAIPHIIVEGQGHFELVLVRATEGINFPRAEEPVRAMFVLAGSKDERNYHLRALMAIAQIAQEKNFDKRWLNARDAEGLRNMILLSTRKRDHE